MLYLIGMGMHSKDMSLKALDICKKSSRVFAELYTSPWQGNLRNVEKLIKKKVKIVGRKELEDCMQDFLEMAKNEDIVILIPGDPLIATTHMSLIFEAKKANIAYEIVHAPSVLTCISRTGLHIYKFGKVLSIPRFSKRYGISSFYLEMLKNLEINAHTLFLIDIDIEPREALKVLKEIDKKNKRIFEKKKIVVCSCLCDKNELILYGKISKIIKNDIKKPACIIVPAELHFTEMEFLKQFSV